MSATHSGHVAVAACFSLNRSHSAHKSGLKTMAEATRFVFYLPVGLGPSFVSAFFFVLPAVRRLPVTEWAKRVAAAAKMRWLPPGPPKRDGARIGAACGAGLALMRGDLGTRDAERPMVREVWDEAFGSASASSSAPRARTAAARSRRSTCDGPTCSSTS